MDILIGEKLSSIYVANMDIIYWPIRSSSRRGKDKIKRVDGGYHYFSQLPKSLNSSTGKSGVTSM